LNCDAFSCDNILCASIPILEFRTRSCKKKVRSKEVMWHLRRTILSSFWYFQQPLDQWDANYDRAHLEIAANICSSFVCRYLWDNSLFQENCINLQIPHKNKYDDRWRSPWYPLRLSAVTLWRKCLSALNDFWLRFKYTTFIIGGIPWEDFVQQISMARQALVGPVVSHNFKKL
jgi:hypothetical protein